MVAGNDVKDKSVIISVVFVCLFICFDEKLLNLKAIECFLF